MRNISFSLTEKQFLDGSKDVTRRLGWKFLKPGDRLMACRKCMGLKPGEKIVRLGEIEVVSVRYESLKCMTANAAYGLDEAAREGFPQMTGGQFVEMFCRHMAARPETVITRIEFRRVFRPGTYLVSGLNCPQGECLVIDDERGFPTIFINRVARWPIHMLPPGTKIQLLSYPFAA